MPLSDGGGVQVDTTDTLEGIQELALAASQAGDFVLFVRTAAVLLRRLIRAPSAAFPLQVCTGVVSHACTAPASPAVTHCPWVAVMRLPRSMAASILSRFRRCAQHGTATVLPCASYANLPLPLPLPPLHTALQDAGAVVDAAAAAARSEAQAVLTAMGRLLRQVCPGTERRG